MSERVRYSVAELEELKDSPLVKKPDGFEGIPSEWLEAAPRWKPQNERKEASSRRQRSNHKGEPHQRTNTHDHSRHHKREAFEEAESEALPEWDDVSEPWVHSAAGDIDEFEHWKQKQRRAALKEAGFDDVHEETASVSSSVKEEAPKPEEKLERKIDVWDAQNVSFKKTGGASRFSFMGQQRQMPPAQPPKPDAGNDDFFNSLLEKRPTPDSSAPPGLTQGNRPQQQGMGQQPTKQGYQGQGFQGLPAGYQVPPGFPMHFQAPPGFQGPPGMQGYPGFQPPPGMQGPPGLQQNPQMLGTPAKSTGLQQPPQNPGTPTNFTNSPGMAGASMGMQAPPGLQQTSKPQGTPSKNSGHPSAPPGLPMNPQMSGTPSKSPGMPQSHMQMPQGMNSSPMHQNAAQNSPMAMAQGMMNPNMPRGQYPPGMTAPPGLHPQMMGFPYGYDPRMGQYNGPPPNSYNRPPGL